MINNIDEGKYDVCILGVWYGLNYGSVLTYYGLNRTLNKMGYNVAMVDKPAGDDDDIELEEEVHSRKFAADQNYSIIKVSTLSDFKFLNNYSDRFLVGSDQVWNYGISKFCGNAFYLGFTEDEKIRLAYSSSFGHGTSFTPMEKISDITKLFQRFDSISVREDQAVRMLRDEFGVSGVQVCDPVFLLEREEYLDLIDSYSCQTPNNYLLAYVLDPTPSLGKVLRRIARKKGLNLVVLIDGRKSLSEVQKIIGTDSVYQANDVYEWLTYYANSSFVITDSFHGTCFSMIFKKQFYTIGNKGRGRYRFDSLSNSYYLYDNMTFDFENLEKKVLSAPSIDYGFIDTIIKMERLHGFAWLSKAMMISKKPTEPNINIVPHKECCGCGACINACPVNCISMKTDFETVSYPFIDKEKCIQCEKCKQVCPALHQTRFNDEQPDCYAAYTLDKVRMKSSSGGIFSLLADWILDKGGIIFGAAFDEQFELHQISAETQEELVALRQSKYIQSDALFTYRETEKALNEGKYVLYVGCPCQIAGLNSYLKTQRDNLFTVDLLCHGGPTQKSFNKYLNAIHKGKDITYISFRDKDYYGWSTEMTIKYSNGETYRNVRSKDWFYRAFLPCLSVRPHCQVCNYATLPRQGDLTLGDFWGVSKYNEQLTDGKGTSIISVNSEKGNIAIKAIRDRLHLLEEIDINYILTHGQPYNRPFKINRNRSRFTRVLNDSSFRSALASCSRDAFNYGLIYVDDDNPVGIINNFSIFRKLANSNYSVIVEPKSWRMSNEISPWKYWFNQFAISYYHELGSDHSEKSYSGLLKKCNGLAVRESIDSYDWTFNQDHFEVFSYQDSIENKFGLPPAFMLEIQDLDEIVSLEKLNSSDGYIVSYFENNDFASLNDEIVKTIDSSLISLNEEQPIDVWLSNFVYADGIITDSKDILALAINFEKPIITVGTSLQNIDCLVDLLTIIGDPNLPLLHPNDIGTYLRNNSFKIINLENSSDLKCKILEARKEFKRCARECFRKDYFMSDSDIKFQRKQQIIKDFKEKIKVPLRKLKHGIHKVKTVWSNL